MILKLQKLREGTEYQSYRLAIPKAVIESKNWQDSDFKLELKDDCLVLRVVKKEKKK